jgi:hypothetical protein
MLKFSNKIFSFFFLSIYFQQASFLFFVTIASHKRQNEREEKK